MLKCGCGVRMNRLALLLVVCLGFLACANKPHYSNPIISMDLSDPDVLRVGSDYYMTVSSFNMTPGLPIYHSKDLVNWRLIGHGVNHNPTATFPSLRRSVDELDYDQPRPSMGVWAPSFEYHNGYYWIFWGDPDSGVFRVRARSPEGPWEKPVKVYEALGVIDPSVVWDEASGKAYMVHAYAKSRAGFSSVLDIVEIDYGANQVIGEHQRIYDAALPTHFPSDQVHQVIEGPKIDKIGDWFYILAPAGGVESGWQVAMRSKHPLGPYEIKTVGHTGNTNINGPHQGALVDTQQGDWWFLHFQAASTLGRILRIEPAFWQAGWPVTGVDPDGDGIGEPVHEYAYPLPKVAKGFVIPKSDDFEHDTLGLQWQWPANRQKDWYELKDGELALKAIYEAQQPLEAMPNVINQMFPGSSFTVTAKVDVPRTGLRGSLVALGRKAFDLGVESHGDNTAKVSVRFNGRELDGQSIKGNRVWLRLDVQGELPLPLVRRPNIGFGTAVNLEGDLPDYESEDLDRWENGILKGQFSFSTDGKTFQKLGGLYTLRSGWWTGARWGLAALKTDSEMDGVFFVEEVEVVTRG